METKWTDENGPIFLTVEKADRIEMGKPERALRC